MKTKRTTPNITYANQMNQSDTHHRTALLNLKPLVIHIKQVKNLATFFKKNLVFVLEKIHPKKRKEQKQIIKNHFNQHVENEKNTANQSEYKNAKTLTVTPDFKSIFSDQKGDLQATKQQDPPPAQKAPEIVAKKMNPPEHQNADAINVNPDSKRIPYDQEGDFQVTKQQEKLPEILENGNVQEEEKEKLLKLLLHSQGRRIVDATNAHLEGMCLKHKNFSGAKFKEAKMQKTTLCYSKLDRVDFTGADLSYSDMSGADVSDSDFTGANLIGAKLFFLGIHAMKFLKMPRANLSKQNFAKMKMSGGNFQGANLSGADLRYADLSDSNLRDANLRGANLSGVNLRGADLSGADLNDVDLSGVDLNGVNLRGAILDQSVLPRLFRVNLKGVEINLNKIRFSMINTAPPRDRGVLCLEIPHEWNNATCKKYLGHTSGWNLLKTIDSIDCEKTKVRLASELIDSLKDADVSSVKSSVFSALYTLPYILDSHIFTALNQINPNYATDILKKYDRDPMPEMNDPLFYILQKFFLESPHLRFDCNRTFNQFTARCLEKGGEKAEWAIKNYNNYLNDNRCTPYVKKADFGDYDNHKPDWQNHSAPNLILFSKTGQLTMMLSSEALNRMSTLNPQNLPKFDHFFLYDQNENDLNISHYNKTLFEHYFPIFLPTYLEMARRANLDKLLEKLKLGTLHDLFKNALENRTITRDQTDSEQNKLFKELESTFLQHLEYSTEKDTYSLKETHYKDLLKVYDLSFADNSKKAKIFLSLTYMFTYLSSMSMFGTEETSPEILRQYADACMTKARELDLSIFYCKQNTDYYEDWRNRLLSTKSGVFTCSAVLATMMLNHAKNQCYEIISNITPPAWS